MKRMIVGLDHDGTFTEDPDLWISIIDSLQRKGHEVLVVTMRYPSENQDIDHRLGIRCKVIFTSRLNKYKECIRQLGYAPTIWIDDHPECVHNSAAEVWGSSAVLGEGIIHTANAIQVSHGNLIRSK